MDTPGRLAVFGGALSSPQQRSAAEPPLSRRDAFVRWLEANREDLAKHLLLPESYNDWNEFSTYADLLRFEEDLGYITSAVVIFLEAPGSIAELGAFSQIQTLKNQLVLVVADCHHPKKSFISLGPLRQLENDGNSSVCVIPDQPPSELATDIDVIIDQVDARVKSSSTRRIFQAENKQHQFLLALDIITLFEVATFGEVRSALTHYGALITESRIRQLLYTLSRANLIATQRYGGLDYYYPLERGRTWVDHDSSATTIAFHRSRVSARIASARTGNRSASRAHSLAFQKAQP